MSVCAMSHFTTRATVLVKSVISSQSPAMTGLLEHVYVQEGSNSRLYTYPFYYKYALISRNFLIPLHALCTVLCTHFLSLL